ncbi:PD-(D/E)XK nuclease family protein [Candidatus Omnitrophota bacterium]
MAKMRLSPTGSLALFLDCPRCYWLQMNKKIKRPRGIFPSLPGGMDVAIKAYFDTFRKKNAMPPEIDGKIKGTLLQDEDLLNKWRSWRSTNLKYEDKSLDATISGALDDCAIDDGCYIPLDYKTRGSEVRGDPRKYYQHQLDCYCFILQESGYKTKNVAYLIYYYPTKVEANGLVTFAVQPIEIETNLNNAKKLFEDAVNFLKEPMPKMNPDCEYCTWLEKAAHVKEAQSQADFGW